MKTTRRKLLRDSALASIGYWVATRDVWAQGRSPNEKLRVACIGVGGKGKTDVASVADAGAEIVALCDVDDERGKATYEKFPEGPAVPRLPRDVRQDAQADRRGHRQHARPHARRPDHDGHEARQARLHAEAADAHGARGPAAQRNGPASTRSSRRWATRAPRWQLAARGDRGDPGRAASGPSARCTCGRIGRSGRRGRRPDQNKSVRSVAHGEPKRPAVPATLQWDLWLGCAPERVYDPIYVPFKWRGWWDFGTGALGDMACHLMNMPYHALKLGYPTTVEAQAAPDLNEETYPSWSIVTYEFPARGELPPVKLTWYDGGKNRPEWATRKLLELTDSKRLPPQRVCVRGRERDARDGPRDRGRVLRWFHERNSRISSRRRRPLPRVSESLPGMGAGLRGEQARDAHVEVLDGRSAHRDGAAGLRGHAGQGGSWSGTLRA